MCGPVLLSQLLLKNFRTLDSNVFCMCRSGHVLQTSKSPPAHPWSGIGNLKDDPNQQLKNFIPHVGGYVDRDSFTQAFAFPDSVRIKWIRQELVERLYLQSHRRREIKEG